MRVAVFCWNLSNNAAGRAFTLAEAYSTFSDVTIVGVLVSGQKLWAPAQASCVKVQIITLEKWSDFYAHAESHVKSNQFDVVHLSKARAPSMLFGALSRRYSPGKIFIDIDDDELAFFDENQRKHVHPYVLDDYYYTEASQKYIEYFDGITTCNEALQKKHGGEIIGHVRNSDAYDKARLNRSRTRANLLIDPLDRVVVFLGTPRLHKGLVETAKAIQELNRNDIVFLIVGSFEDDNLKNDLLQIAGVRYIFLEDCKLERAPDILVAGDLCVFAQDIYSPIASVQTPAKISDAFAAGIPVISTVTPAISGIWKTGAIYRTTTHTISNAIATVLSNDSVRNALIRKSNAYFNKNLSIESARLVINKMLKTWALSVKDSTEIVHKLGWVLQDRR